MLANHDLPAGTPEDPVPIIGATLCLMSCVMQSGNALYVAKIADNLALLAEHPNIDDSFRRICRRLCQHWDGCINAQAGDDDGGAASVEAGLQPFAQVH